MSNLHGAILVLTATPGRAAELARALGSTDNGRVVLSSFSLDPMEQRTVEDARLALRASYRLDAATILPYAAVAVFGDVPLSKRAIDDLRAASGQGVKFCFVGVTDGAEQQAALNGANVYHVARLEALAVEFPFQLSQAWKAAQAEAVRQVEAATASQPAVQYNVIKGQERSGLLPAGGTIMVHANKGGAGKSTVAASIAYGLALSSPTYLVDLNPSGAHVHQSFGKWLAMEENGGFRTDDELLGIKGLSVLSNKIDWNTTGSSIDGSHLASVTVPLIPHGTLRGQLNLSLIPGFRSQHDYQIGFEKETTPARDMLFKKKWANDLVGLLRNQVKSGYVVFDTGDTEANAPTALLLSTADVIVWLVNCSTRRLMDDEFRHLAEMIKRYSAGGRLAAKLLVVGNLIASSTDRLQMPNAPTAAEAEKLFTSLRAPGVSVEFAPLQRDLRALSLADDEQLPVLALGAMGAKYASLPLVGDLTVVVNRINGSMEVSTVSKKSGGGFSLFGKKKG